MRDPGEDQPRTVLRRARVHLVCFPGCPPEALFPAARSPIPRASRCLLGPQNGGTIIFLLCWPWYKVDYAAARHLGIPEAADMHRFVMGILQSGPTYSQAYRSAYIYRTSERIGRLACPALVCAGPNDMLVDGLAHAKRLGGENISVAVTPTTAWWPAQRPEEVEAYAPGLRRVLRRSPCGPVTRFPGAKNWFRRDF